MSQCSRFFQFSASIFLLIAISGCDYYADRMSVGEQQLKQGKYPQAEEAFAEATTAAAVNRLWGSVAAGNLTITIPADNTADLAVHYIVDGR